MDDMRQNRIQAQYEGLRARASHNVAQGEQRVADQIALLLRLKKHRIDTAQALDLLAVLEATLDVMRQYEQALNVQKKAQNPTARLSLQSPSVNANDITIAWIHFRERITAVLTPDELAHYDAYEQRIAESSSGNTHMLLTREDQRILDIIAADTQAVALQRQLLALVGVVKMYD